jgi:hypothetical protein
MRTRTAAVEVEEDAAPQRGGGALNGEGGCLLLHGAAEGEAEDGDDRVDKDADDCVDEDADGRV